MRSDAYEAKGLPMIIDKYWGRYFGDSPDSAVLVAYLDDKGEEILDVADIFRDLGLEELHGNYTDAQLDADVATPAGEKHYHFDHAFQVIMDLSVLLLESKSTRRFNLARVGGADDRFMRIDSQPKHNTQITTALKYFALMPEEHAITERFEDDDWDEVGNLCEEIRGQLD